MTRIVIAEDEPLARKRLRQALARIADIEIVGVARDGREALGLIATSSPDVVLLDIMMPELNGLDLVAGLQAGSAPAVIFVTAYDRFATRAFDADAVDYVLKPIDDERLARAIARARERLATRSAEQRVTELQEIIVRLSREHGKEERPRYETELWVTERGQVRRVAMCDVLWFQAAGDYVVVHTARASHSIYDSLSALAKRLDPGQFQRVHRSAIVGRSAVAAITRVRFGRLRLTLSSRAVVAVGRSYQQAVEAAFQIRR